MKCLIKVHNEIKCSFQGLSEEHLTFLWNKFGPFKNGYKYMLPYKLGRWDGRIRFIDKRGVTSVKLLEMIIPYLDNWGYEIDLEDNRPFYELPPLVDENIFQEHGITLRPHQVIGTNKLLEVGSGIGILATGAGKSLLTAAISWSMNQVGYQAITVVPSLDLVEQTFEWYEKVGLDVGKYCGSEKDIHHMNVISTWQSLQNNPYLISSGKFQCIIWDETHSSAAQVAQELLQDHGKNIPYRFGVTGTFPKDEVSKLSIHSAFGNIVYTMNARWLMDNEYLTPVEIETFMIKEKVKEDFPDYNAEKNYLIKNSDRIELLADLIITKCDQFGNTLVLVNSVQFGQKIADLIEGAVFLYGATDNDTRKEHYDMFETEDSLIRIATYGIASTGISIDRVFNLMMIDPGVSFTKCIQSIGRSLRKADDKEVAHVCDVYSSLKWSKKHARERIKYYKEAEYPVISSVEIKM